MQRGILGHKKDPKNPVLYFLDHDEDWPSEDSNDADYEMKKKSERSSDKDDDGEKQVEARVAEPAQKGRLVLKCRKVHASGKGNDSEKNKKHVKWKMESSGEGGATNSANKRSKAKSKCKPKAEAGKEATEEKMEVEEDGETVEDDGDLSPSAWGTLIPLEVLLRIFSFVVRQEGAITFYERVRNVCKLWCSAAKHSSLWSSVDLSFPKVRLVESELQHLCKECLGNTREMSLSGWKRQLTMNGIQVIGDHCQSLTAINLSECTNVNGKAIRLMVDKCPKLTSIDVSHTAPSGGADSAVSCESLGYIMSKCGDKLTHLNLAGNFVGDLQKLLASEGWFPALKHLNLSGCSKLNENTMRVIADKCPVLNSIDLSHTSPSAAANGPCSSTALRYLVSKCGSNVRNLNLSNNIMRTFSGIFTILANSCHNLQVLDMTNASNIDRSIISIPIEKLQEGCPKLKILRLANVRTLLANTPLAAQAVSPGFPELEELSTAVINQEYHHGLDDSSLERILKTSNKLKLLDVRGCSRITASGMVRFPAFDIEYLFLSQCPAAMTADIELVMEKWRHSLVEVDLSWNNHAGDAVDAAVKSLAGSSTKSILHTLNLSGSAVSYEPVKAVLKNCPNLSVLDLSSCRGLPRGIKRLYRGEDLHKFQAEEAEAL